MADNTTLNTGTGGDIISTDAITTLNGASIATGEKAQRVKVGWGIDGTFNDASATTPIPVAQLSNSVVSVVNSTTTNLGIGVAFTGTAEDVSEYSTVVVSIFSNVASTTSGCQLQFSMDGTNWDITDNYSVPAATGTSFSTGVVAKFFRVFYMNGGTASTTLRIQTIYSKAAKKGSSNRPRDTRANDFDSEDVSAHLMGYNSSADQWNRIPSTTSGLKIIGGSSTTTSGSIAAAGTGTVGPLNVADAGNVTFIIKNTTAASAFAGAPVLVFEQSDDNSSWAPLPVVRSDTNAIASTWTLSANAASTEIMFNAPLPGVTWVRVRCTTGPTTNAMTIVIQPGGFLSQPYSTVVEKKDSGRVPKTITLDSFAIVATTETLHTMSFSSANGTLTTGTSYNVTAGKTFRVQSIMIGQHTIAGNTTAVNVLVRMRANNAGAAVVGSPLQLIVPLQGIAAANSAAPIVFADIPDGWEFPGGSGIGFTSTCAGFVTTTAAPKLDITLIGYEY